MEIAFLFGILFIAALPVILAFVFLELKSEKQGFHVQDKGRKAAKILGWSLFVLLVITVLYLMQDSTRPNWFRLFGYFFHLFEFIK